MIAAAHVTPSQNESHPSLARRVGLPLAYWTVVSVALSIVIVQHGLAPFRANPSVYLTARVGAYVSAFGSMLMIIAFAAAAALGTRAALAWLHIRGGYRDALIVGASAFWVLGTYALVGLVAFLVLQPRPLPYVIFRSATRYAHALMMQQPLGALQHYRWFAAAGAAVVMVGSAWRRLQCSLGDALLIVGIALGVVCAIALLLHTLITSFAIVP